ncbi:MAG: hypothetical protein Q7R31_00115 [Candidatus Levybacteria bacterium]|nr:hypothetical protein [Candidatus Levybacteria bacterium]
MSTIEHIRKRMGDSHLVPFGRLNQRKIREIEEARRRIEGNTQSKGYKADQRQQKFIENLSRKQFERALGHMADGTATPEDIDYVFRQADRFGRPMGKVTILDLSRNGKI